MCRSGERERERSVLMKTFTSSVTTGGDAAKSGDALLMTKVVMVINIG